MTIRRRTFDLPEGTRQIIVTHDDATHEFYVGHRAAAWDEWSRPLTHTTVEDDTPVAELGPEAVDRHAPGDREYRAE